MLHNIKFNNSSNKQSWCTKSCKTNFVEQEMHTSHSTQIENEFWICNDVINQIIPTRKVSNSVSATCVSCLPKLV